MRTRVALAGLLVAATLTTTGAAGAAVGGCPVFPTDNVWHADIAQLPVNAHSAAWLASTAAATTNLHPDFGPSDDPAVPYGIPFTVVPDSHPKVPVTFDFADESDPGPYPFGADTPIEGGANSDGDRHAIMLDSGNCHLYELFDAHYAAGGSTAGSGAVWDLNSDALRPSGWTSADAAGLPILPGLLRPDEVAAGHVDHAIRFTANTTDTSFVWPARHQAGARSDPSLPPMGARARLKANFDTSGFRPDTKVILAAMQQYGMILADNGSNWFFSGAADPAWNPDLIEDLKRIPASAFEFVDESSLMSDPNSGTAGPSAPPPGTSRLAGATRYGTAAAIAAAAFPNGASDAVVVSGNTFADALTGAYLAGAVHGPVLLTDPAAVPAELTAALDQLHATHLWLLGGTLAVSSAVEQQLRARAGTTVTRLAGATRYDTMAAVDRSQPASAVGTVGGQRAAILASGAGFADALAASGAANHAHLPIILTDPNELSAAAASTIQALGVARVLVMGGTLAVSAHVEQEANAAGAATLQRFAGADRTDTAQQFAAYAVGRLGFTNATVLLARGDGFADALAGSSYAGLGNPLLLTVDPSTLGAATTGYIAAHRSEIGTFTALGGATAVTNGALTQAAAARAG